ncbi:MAG: hypothetical protein ABSE73_16795 [Planctomycetota bacterium]
MSKAYPVDFKGTAFGDPAAMPRIKKAGDGGLRAIEKAGTGVEAATGTSLKDLTHAVGRLTDVNPTAAVLQSKAPAQAEGAGQVQARAQYARAVATTAPGGNGSANAPKATPGADFKLAFQGAANKGTAFGDPARMPEMTANAAGLQGAVQSGQLNNAPRKANAAEKGTALGDPARAAAGAPRPDAVTAHRRAQPVDFKGTAPSAPAHHQNTARKA